MIPLAFGFGAQKRTEGDFPPFRQLNMYSEAAPTTERQSALLSMPGLELSVARGAGPINGLFCKSGAFDGDVFARSGTALYRGSTALGEVVGDGPVSFATSDTELAVTAGGTLYRYSEADGLDAVAFPDGQDVRHISFHDGLFLAVPQDGETLYWSAVLDADTWGGTDFFSAERDPDRLLECHIIGDVAMLFGTASIEPWANTGDSELPYSRIEQRTFEQGLYGNGCVSRVDNTLFFIAKDALPYRFEEVPQIIGDNSIAERIGASATVSTFTFDKDAHKFFAVRLDDETLLYDVSTRQWHEAGSYGLSNWRANCATMSGRKALFGDADDGEIWQFGGWQDDEGTLERLFTAGAALSAPTTIHNLELEVNSGATGLLTGLGSDPVIEMRTSRDGGKTWGDWEPASLGAQGDYSIKVQWRRLGLFARPGIVAEFRCTDPVPLRVSNVRCNVPNGGRFG